MSDTPLILAFDTSFSRCAAALLRNGEIVAERDEEMARGQAERLVPMLQEVMAEAGVRWGALDALAVATGPGNFTGIRICIAAARGLAMGLERPAIGVTGFEALAWNSNGPVLVTMENRRGPVFSQFFQNGIASGSPIIGTPDPTLISAGTVCIGHDAAVVADELGLAHAAVTMPPPVSAYAHVAARRAGETHEPPAPLYLRPPDAAPSRELPPVLIDDA